MDNLSKCLKCGRVMDRFWLTETDQLCLKCKLNDGELVKQAEIMAAPFRHLEAAFKIAFGAKAPKSSGRK